MRLPFVSRDVYDDLRAQRDALEARYAALVADLLQMKREGYEPQPAPEAPVEPLPDLPDLLETTLDDLALTPRERAREESRIRGWITEGMTPDVALTRLLEGTA